MTDAANDTVPGRTGGCVCGRIRYVATGAPLRVTLCHCTWCQRRTGTAFGAEVVYTHDQLRFEADRPAAYRHRSDESGRWLDQRFCPSCGTNLGMTLEAAPGVVTVPAGSFDDPSWLQREGVEFRHVHMASAQDWSRLPEGALAYDKHFRS